MHTYIEAAGRRGVTPDAARTIVRTNATVIAALAVRRGEADAMICGLEGRYMRHLHHIRDIIGLAPGVRRFRGALAGHHRARAPISSPTRRSTTDPTAEEIAEMAVLAAAHVRRFGLEPKIALLSHSDFGCYDSASARKMRARAARSCCASASRSRGRRRDARRFRARARRIRERVFPHSRLKGEANVLIMPNLDAANIAYQMIKVLADALPVGPILIGAARPAHILTPSVTARGVVNMTAIAAVEAQAQTP